MNAVLLALAVATGAATQRITGMGFALMAAPLLVLLLGADDGVALSQALTMLASVVVLAELRRAVEWRTAGLLLLAALVGIVPGAWLTRQLSAPTLAILIGCSVVVALTAVTMDERARVFTGRIGGAASGFLSGFMNVTAGVGGPPIVLYRLSTDWPHLPFLATVQVYFIGLNLASLSARGVPSIDGVLWFAAISALLVGLVAGERLSRRVSEASARRLIVVVALGGSIATVAKGVLALS